MKKMGIVQAIILFFKGVVVGFGAIMPGISGGTLCVAFGMYNILLEVLSHPFKTLRKHWAVIVVFVLGAGVGFVGLSGLAGWLLDMNSQMVTCAFMGFIIGTIPELWRNAGEKYRRRSSYVSMVVGFVVLLTILLLVRNAESITIAPGIGGFFLCGIFWGLSFIVPGLSSSTFLLFFGLYQPMLEGISHLSLPVLIPLAAGVILCMVILPKGVEALFRKWHSEASHAILGIVAASTLLIFPVELLQSPTQILIGLLFVIGGAVVSYALSCLCDRLQQGQE